MKVLKHAFLNIILILIAVLATSYLEPDNPFLVFITLLIVAFFAFNLFVRTSPSFKNYFISKNNLLTAKFNFEKTYDIPRSLMFFKTIEVLEQSKFKVIDANEEKFEILAITSMTFTSWGENLYINFETSGDETTMKLCSATLFQISSWNKNEKNIQSLLDQIENSLVI